MTRVTRAPRPDLSSVARCPVCRVPAPLRRRYDFVTCTELVKHFHDPYEEFERIAGLLNPGGWRCEIPAKDVALMQLPD